MLYSPDSIYNVHGAHLTLAEYQASMNAALQATDIQMGQFRNMILSGDWAGIHYWNMITDENGTAQPMDTMTFMHFVNTADGVKVDMCNVNQGF